ncbi:hypothetical protein A2U01_0060604, partial [Trifolium medium]|nr:hypothetical protein [Trifolium medium]
WGSGNLWFSYAPSKVIVFSWQLVLGRLPTRANLAVRGVFGGDSDPSCVWCPGVREAEHHLFVTCAFASNIWYNFFNWFGVTSVA